MPETGLERKRRLARERKRRQRLSGDKNEYESEIRRRKVCLRQLVRRLKDSQEKEVLERRRKDRQRMVEEEIRNSLQAEIEEIRRKNRETIAKTTARLSLEEIEERRRIAREKIALKKRQNSPQEEEETEERKKKQRERTAERRKNESGEAAFLRRQKSAENMRRLRSGVRIRRDPSSSATTSTILTMSSSSSSSSSVNYSSPSPSSSSSVDSPLRRASFAQLTVAKNLNKTAGNQFKNQTQSFENKVERASFAQLTEAKNLNKTAGKQFKDQSFEKSREQKVMTHPVQPSPPLAPVQPSPPLAPVQPSPPPAFNKMQFTRIKTQQQLRKHAQLPVPIQPAPTRVPVLALPVQVSVTKQKSVEKTQPQEKRLFVVANHQRYLMTNLASFWKSGKLCDASIGNGSSTVKVHKLVLYAMCPKLLSVSNMDVKSHEFLQVNFPKEVSEEALNAFAEYMYNGILDLDPDILEQMKIIAKRLDMKVFEQLCDSHLPKSSFANVLFLQAAMPIPGMPTSSLASLSNPVSAANQSSASAITCQIVDNKLEISEAELTQVKKEPTAMFGQESDVAPPAPTKSENTTSDRVISTNIKTETVGPEDDKYGHWSGSSSSGKQAFTPTNTSFLSPSISTATASVPISSTESAFPFSQSTDVKTTKLKNPHPTVSEFSSVCSQSLQSSSMNEDPPKPFCQLPTDSPRTVNLQNNYNNIYPVRLSSAKGDNLPLLTPHSSDTNSFIPTPKT